MRPWDEPDAVIACGITALRRGHEAGCVNADGNTKSQAPEAIRDGNDFQNKKACIANDSGPERITLDLNLLDFKSMTGIPKMTSVNSLEISKPMRAGDRIISIYGLSGEKEGGMKKVRDRQTAVRMLVETGLIQVVGRHLRLPYWRLLGANIMPDPVVVESVEEYYSCLRRGEAVAVAQTWLRLYGYDLAATGVLDTWTQNALRQVDPDFDPAQGRVNLATFIKVYENIPVTRETRKIRRGMIAWNRGGADDENIDWDGGCRTRPGTVPCGASRR